MENLIKVPTFIEQNKNRKRSRSLSLNDLSLNNEYCLYTVERENKRISTLTIYLLQIIYYNLFNHQRLGPGVSLTRQLDKPYKTLEYFNLLLNKCSKRRLRASTDVLFIEQFSKINADL